MEYETQSQSEETGLPGVATGTTVTEKSWGAVMRGSAQAPPSRFLSIHSEGALFFKIIAAAFAVVFAYWAVVQTWE